MLLPSSAWRPTLSLRCWPTSALSRKCCYLPLESNVFIWESVTKWGGLFCSLSGRHCDFLRQRFSVYRETCFYLPSPRWTKELRLDRHKRLLRHARGVMSDRAAKTKCYSTSCAKHRGGSRAHARRGHEAHTTFFKQKKQQTKSALSRFLLEKKMSKRQSQHTAGF